MNRPISDKQQSFVDHYCTDANHNASMAYRMAGYSHLGANAHSSNLVAKSSIKQAITTKQAKLRTEKGFTVDDVHKLYERAFDLAEDKHQTGSMVGAATGIARLYGMDRDAGGNKEQTIIIIGPKQAKVIDSKEIEDA